MKKEKLINKLNIKDYNSKLEEILAGKTFSEDAKNLLLNMLYSIENAYDDYKKAKVNVKTKKEILEEILAIIENECNEIEIIKPKIDDKKSIKKKSTSLKEKNKIISYPNKKTLLFAIYGLDKKCFKIKDEYDLIKESLEKVLNIGRNINECEIIRDFDGWSWNISKQDIENFSCNFLYQTIMLLIGSEFLEKWLNGIEDYIKELEECLEEKYGEDISEDIIKKIGQNAILISTKTNKPEKDRMLKKQEEFQKEFNDMDNKRTYLQQIANNKKEIEKKIRNIDEIINNTKLLKEEFEKSNEELKDENKFFSLSDFTEKLQEDRIILVLKLNRFSKMMQPITYLKMKEKIEEKLNLIKELDLEKKSKEKEQKMQEELIKLTFSALKKRIEQSEENKKEIIDMIYKIRYYKKVPINNIKNIEDIEQTRKVIEQTEQRLFVKACNLKIINILSSNVKENFNIFKQIMQTEILNLEQITVILKKENEEFLLNIYDEANIDKTIKFKDIKDLNIKLNKKTKIFI